MDATLVKDIGIKALLVGGAVLVSFWTFNAVKLVISARGINPLVRKFFDILSVLITFERSFIYIKFCYSYKGRWIS